MNCTICGKEYADKSLTWYDGSQRTFKVAQCDCEHLADQKEKARLYTQHLLSYCGIPPRYVSDDTRWVDSSDMVRAMREMTERYFDNIKAHILTGQGMMLLGSNGIGKTWLCCRLLERHIRERNGYAKFNGYRDLVNILERNKSTSEDMDLTLEKIIREPLIVLDDIGIVDICDWRKGSISYIIDKRYDHEKATIFTANCTERDLSDRLGSDVVSRIAGMCKGYIIDVDAKDMRR